MFLFANQPNPNSQTGGQWYSDTSPLVLGVCGSRRLVLVDKNSTHLSGRITFAVAAQLDAYGSQDGHDDGSSGHGDDQVDQPVDNVIDLFTLLWGFNK